MANTYALTSEDLIENGQRATSPNPWRINIPVPSIGPAGDFNITFFPRAALSKGEPVGLGMTPVVWLDQAGTFAIAKWARDEGHVLYETLCMGDARDGAGKRIKGSRKHWALWERIAKMFARGRHPQRGELEKVAEQIGGLYHPHVAERRKLADKGGFLALDVDQLLHWLDLDTIKGMDDDDDVDEDDDDLEDIAAMDEEAEARAWAAENELRDAEVRLREAEARAAAAEARARAAAAEARAQLADEAAAQAVAAARPDDEQAGKNRKK